MIKKTLWLGSTKLSVSHIEGEINYPFEIRHNVYQNGVCLQTDLIENFDPIEEIPKPEPKFKVGDYVRVVKQVLDFTFLASTIGIISKVTLKPNLKYSYIVKAYNDYWYYKESQLEDPKNPQ